MTSTLVQQLTGVRDLKKILETTVKELGETFRAEVCQVVLSDPLDPNVVNICEYRATAGQENGRELPSVTVPLSLQGKSFGHLAMARQEAVSPDEVNTIRVILGEMGDIIRHAQINDIVQRDTFREQFMVEIGNVMAISLGIGDALFMVVNILGKVLHASRCLFICTDDTQAGWKCYEFWQQDKVQSCQQYCWPTTDSPAVAQTLLATSPLIVYEGQQNSYVTPLQEELQFIGARSFLGVPLRSETATHGCVILQQCDYRRAWTRGEIDMVQNVADRVAEALLKLPAEKRAREPIMQLHQRTVAVPEDAAVKQSIESVRRALKGALGQQSIPVAQKTSAPAPPKPPAPKPAPPPQPAPAAPAPPAPPPFQAPPPAVAGAQESFAPPPPGGKGLGSILGGIKQGAGATAMAALDLGGPTTPTAPEIPPPPPEQAAAAAPAQAWGTPEGQTPAQTSPWGAPQEGQAGSPWAAPEAPAPGGQAAVAEQPPNGSPWGNLDAIPTPGQGAAPRSREGKWGDLDAIGSAPAQTVAPPARPSQWGDLDSIPTPSGGPGKPGLAAMAKQKGPHVTSPLLASLHKDKAKFAEPAPAPAEFVEGPPIQIDEAQAQAKLQQILASASPTSDYIFATAGLDTRMLGRIDGWVSQIEQKDKYLNGHARQVAEYATAIARQAGLSEEEVGTVRLAALVHDVGKLGSAPQVLQKPDEELSDGELLLTMKHPLDGAELLESFPDLKHLAPIVRAHHEEYDGNGYPAGLKGEEIPVLARVIHVADSYHLLTSPMRFRQGMSPTDAQQVLTRGAGKQWDPRFVEALILAIMQQKVPASF